jgi:hypothetical protein
VDRPRDGEDEEDEASSLALAAFCAGGGQHSNRRELQLSSRWAGRTRGLSLSSMVADMHTHDRRQLGALEKIDFHSSRKCFVTLFSLNINARQRESSAATLSGGLLYCCWRDESLHNDYGAHFHTLDTHTNQPDRIQ